MNFNKLFTTGILLTVMSSSVLAAGQRDQRTSEKRDQRPTYEREQRPTYEKDPARCDHFVRGVFRLENQVNRLKEDAHQARNRHITLNKRLQNREAALDSRTSELRNAKGALDRLRFDNNNGARLIKDNRNSILSLNSDIINERPKIRPLKKIYEDTSKWKVIKRAKAKKAYKNQRALVRELSNLVSTHRGEINRINDILNNFDNYEADGEDRIFNAKDQLYMEQGVLPTINTLASRVDFAHQKLRNIRYEKKTRVDRLNMTRKKLKSCRAR